MTTHTTPDGRELRRPTTAGPWHPYKRNAGVVLAACPEAENASGLVQVAASAPGDGPAIADLPDWIARADMLAERLEKAEAVLTEVVRRCVEQVDGRNSCAEDDASTFALDLLTWMDAQGVRARDAT